MAHTIEPIQKGPMWHEIPAPFNYFVKSLLQDGDRICYRIDSELKRYIKDGKIVNQFGSYVGNLDAYDENLRYHTDYCPVTDLDIVKVISINGFQYNTGNE